MPGRTRRATAKAIDYAKQQEFSDPEDLFEDAPPEPPTTEKKRGRPRKSKATVVETADEDEGVLQSEKPVYTEKGYDSSMPPLRERFPFLPEYEEDGSPKIELIVGRRPIDEKEDAAKEDSDDAAADSSDDTPKPVRKTRGRAGKDTSPATKTKNDGQVIEYEYLIKFRGRSYLHLEWKRGADLESMNKSAKGIYRRFLKKLEAGVGDMEELENPEFDPSYVVPEKIIDEADQEITVELSDKEVLKWEKEREKEIEAGKNGGADDADDEGKGKKTKNESKSTKKVTPVDKKEAKSKKEEDDDEELEWPDEVDFHDLPVDFLRKVLKKEDPFYPYVEGCDNPYRDGYATEPPKKPRASYLFFQCTMRQYFIRKYPDFSQTELMAKMGETWRGLDDEGRLSFQALADEESAEYDRQKILLDKAQKPNGVWQPIRRCRMVLDRLANDSFAEIFLEPVDLEEFPDYQDIVDVMMDLRTVRERLESKKYQVPEQFARDMRRIWNNCKIYNQHGSAIWHVADYMSKQFERLYHAWVLEFRERYLRWADPKARPWEHSCRATDGKCGTPDDKMVLCDHCDAMYGICCLKPPLKKVPTKAWHCPDCKPKLKSAKGSRMLSALAENAARKRAELGDIPSKKTNRTMYLVKWKGLGYEFCTWESKDDIGNDSLISQFHQREKGYSDEADMPGEILDNFMNSVTHVNEENAGGSGIFPMMRSQLYAQSRGAHFLKFGMNMPKRVGWEMGPRTAATGHCEEVVHPGVIERDEKHPRAVVECLGEMVLRVAQGRRAKSQRSHTSIPPPLTGEYDAIIPITAKGLMMNVGEIHGSVAFLGYRQLPDGSKGPAETAKIVRNVGDKIVAVDGVSTFGKSFKEVIDMLKETGKNRYAYMRFLENRYGAVDNAISSVGSDGRYAYEEQQIKFATDRRRIVLKRKTDSLEVEAAHAESEDDEVSSKEDGSDDESSVDSEGSFAPDSDDDDLFDNFDMKKEAAQSKPPGTSTPEGPNEEAQSVETAKDSQATKEEVSAKGDSPEVEIKRGKPEELKLLREETTRSLGLRLLQTDLGYSSDEGGDEDCAFFIDGVDATFHRSSELVEVKKPSPTKQSREVKDGNIVPTSRSQFSALGDRSKLAAVMALTVDPPKEELFTTFPEVPKTTKRAESPTPKSTKRSTVKVEQVNATTGEVIHVWANVEATAATLQLPLNILRQILSEEYDDDVGEEVGGFKWRYALAGAKVTAGNKEATRGGGGKKAKEAWLEFRDKLYDPSEPHAYKNGNRLRDYQVDGVNWLASTWYKKQGCILADEMGLGKTVQIVCYIEHLFRAEKIHRPFLVVVPLSTVEHWRREFEGWTDIVCCVYHDRQRIWRDVMREYEWYYEDKPHTPEFLKFDVLVTTYDTLIGDFDVVSQIPFRVAVVDEAHRLRNQKGKLLECMREISARGTMQYGFQSRVLMSGTPLQNDLTELWTLLNFIEPFKFADPDDFQARFGSMANRGQVEALQQIISPFMLRRVKEDVAKDIPAKEETVIDVELTSVQKQYYRAIFEHNHAFLNLGGTRVNAPKLMNIQMELRKVCNHPFLLDGIEHRETDRLYKEFTEKGAFEGKTPAEQQQMLTEHGYIMSSGKMVLLDKLLPKLRQEGHKILVFSQMVKMIDLISEYCDFRGFNYERLDGRVRGSDRQKSIDRFEREKDSFLFLLSTRAGGVGINLTAADICIIFDSDWNPQNDVQAQARCHRIGQTKDVRIYRLVTSRSFEQEMFDRASKKLGLEQAVLGTFEKGEEDDKPSQQEMEQLLRKGAYALLDDDDQVTNEFCADDIESILAKRTRTRVVEGTKTASWLNKQGMVVSKSKFTSESGKTLDMDDPLFWQKVMPDFVTPSIMAKRFKDLEDEIEGKVRGPGRGRWRQKRMEEAKKKAELEAKSIAPTDETQEPVEEATNENGGEEKVVVEELENGDEKEEVEGGQEEDEEEDSDDDGKSSKLSRGHVRKIHKFMNELKSMMLNIFEDEDEEEETLSPEEKSACQKMLLTISVKHSMFTEEQRNMARKFLKRVEGDRRRRCRTSDQRFQPGSGEAASHVVREELMIRGKKKKPIKRRRRQDVVDEVDDAVEDLEPAAKRTKRTVEEPVDDEQTDSEEDDWSDVGKDIYEGGAKDKISRKEAVRRRAWLADEDAASAAGRAWPVFPRHMVRKVLTSVLEKVTKHDEESGGVFSVPVPKDEFPEYYEQIRKPMDYGTMKKKLENGEYRSAQSMQKDFLLIMQNCRKFNADSSDIVKEAREQHLLRPQYLKEAAADHDLFLAEDGSVLEIVDEKKKGTSKKKKTDNDEKKGKGTRTRKTPPGSNDERDDGKKRTPKKRGQGKLSPVREDDEEDNGRAATRMADDDAVVKRKRNSTDGDDFDSSPIPKKRKKIEEADPEENGDNGDPTAKFADVGFWQKRRKRLPGTFKAARKNLTEFGPWQLPTRINMDKFPDIALATLDTMKVHDEYKVFAKPVSESEAPGYYERIKNPMDFGTMRKKVADGGYGDSRDATELLYKDFRQTFDNCLIYNDEGDVTEEASRILAFLPEAFAAACAAVMK